MRSASVTSRIGSVTFSLLRDTPPPCTSLRHSPFEGNTCVFFGRQLHERQAQSGAGDAELRHALEDLQQRLLVYPAQRLGGRAAEEDGRGLDGLLVLFPGVDHRGDLLRQALLQHAQVRGGVVLGDERADRFPGRAA